LNPNDYITAMIKIARNAGQRAMEHRERIDEMEVSFKGQADLLCEADEDVEMLIFKSFQKSHPDIAFQGEEGGLRGSEDAELRWVVDPIDGTTNFLSGLPFTISIALVQGTTPIAGVIFSPVEDELFSATIGQGAMLNGTPIKVREQTDPARFVVGTGLPLDRYKHSMGAYDRLHQIREQVSAVRIMGSCALSLANVACGRLDGYFEGPTGFLDCAAGIVILKEAGGKVTDFWGTEDYPENITFTTGAPACQAFLLETTKTAPRGSSKE